MTRSAHLLLSATLSWRSGLLALPLLLGAIGTAAAQPVGSYEVTAQSGLNVRSGPSAEAVKVGRLAPGARVQVIGVSGSWAVIQFNGQERYVAGRYLRPSGASPEEEVQTYQVEAQGGLNVRSGPSTEAAKVGRLADGAQVQLLGVAGDWAKIEFQGQERYVHKGFLRPAGGATDYYDLSGTDSQRGAYTLAVDVQSLGGDRVLVTRDARYADGSREVHRGEGERRGDQIRARLQDRGGISQQLGGGSAAGEVELWLRFGPEGAVSARDRSPRGEGQAQLAPRAPGSRAEPERGRHLLAASSSKVAAKIRKAAAGLAYDGVDLEHTFKISRFFHVGVGGAIEAMKPSELSPSQVAGNKPRQVWLKSRVHGGVKVPLSTRIPLGEVSLGLGFEAGARVDYTVVDLYPMPRGVTDVRTVIGDLRQATVRSFDLPLDASEARGMNVGARRVFEGRAHVAVKGNLTVGRNLGEIGEVARVGASARVGGFYRISGRARIEVERLPNERVRVRLSKAKTHTRGASADLLLEASLNRETMRRELQPAVDYVDQALIDRTKLTPELREALVAVGREVVITGADGVVRRLTRVTIKASVTNTKQDEFDLAFRFDLRNQRARQAYERAVRGDFTEAGREAQDPQSGVTRDHRVLEIENATHLAASLDLSVVFDASFSRKISLRDLSVEDASGKRDYEIWRYQREWATSLFNRDRGRKVDLEVVRRTRPGQGPDHSLRFKLHVTDPSTWASEATSFQRLLKWWGMDGSSSLPAPGEPGFLQPRYGATETKLDVRISDRGITSIMSRDQATYFKAYLYAFTTIKGRPPRWGTEDGRRRLDAMSNDDRGPTEDRERRELRNAREFVRQLDRLGKARNQRERARALKALAGTTRWDLYSIGAIVALAPRSEVSLDASLMGRRIQVVDGVRGAAPFEVVDPR